MILHNVVLNLDAVEIITKRDLTLDIASQRLPGYYWADKRTTVPIGPFPTIHQAMEHYVDVLLFRKGENDTPPEPLLDPTNLPQGKLIQVDFINKKRIS